MRDPKTPPFDKLRVRFSTDTAFAIVLTLSLSKGGDDAPPRPTCRGAATLRPAPNMANFL